MGGIVSGRMTSASASITALFMERPVAAASHHRSKEIRVTVYSRHSPTATPKLNGTESKTMGFCMYTSKRNAAAVLVGFAVALVGLTDVALAGITAVPGPIAGAGLPALT